MEAAGRGARGQAGGTRRRGVGGALLAAPSPEEHAGSGCAARRDAQANMGVFYSGGARGPGKVIRVTPPLAACPQQRALRHLQARLP